MKLRALGKSGLMVSPLCFGGNVLGWTADEPTSIKLLDAMLASGVNFVDTADSYSAWVARHQGGESESVLGRWLKSRGNRERVILATKVGSDMGGGKMGLSKAYILREVEDSLRRLQTDYIDLYQIHVPDPATDIEETLSALSDLIHSGKVRAIGSSKMPASDIVEAQWVAERRGLERFRTEQPPYSLLNRGIEREVLPVAQRYGMGTLVWGPLGQGMLTGRVRKGQQNDLRRAPFLKAMSDERRLDAVEQFVPLAAEAGLPMTHLAMAFAIAHPGVTSALLGPHTMEQLDDLLAGLDVALTDETLDRIDEIVPPGTDVGTLDQAYLPPALQNPSLRRRPVSERAAT